MTLQEFIEREGGSVTSLAERLGRPVTTVHGWVRGTRRPNWRDIPAIEAATNGAVTADDFVPRGEA